MIKTVSRLLGMFLCFVAISAIPGGILMIMNPTGNSIGLPVDMLTDTPFHDFLIPGLFLLIVIGLFNVIGSVLAFKRNDKAGYAGLILGALLLLWIVVQIYFVGLVHFLQPLYFIVGIVEIILGKYYIANVKSKI